MADIKLTINGKECVAPAGSTILQAAELNGIHIPKLCYLEGIHQYGACRICVVEQISPPAKNLQASCMVEARNGMVIDTNNAKVQEARKTMYELLLSNHDKKCLTCARNQDCEFQALGRELGVEDSPYEGERDLRPIDVSESSPVTPISVFFVAVASVFATKCRPRRFSRQRTVDSRLSSLLRLVCPLATPPAPIAASA